MERWTVTTEGTLVKGVSKHYIRICPEDIKNESPQEDPNRGQVAINNRPPGTPWLFPAKDVVDAGFLELVRYGIRKPGDTLIEDSLKVVDAVLKVDTPVGPVWRRYNHDGYGQRPDGGPFEGWGRGRAWPLLTGERGHYELAAGRDAAAFVQALERFASRGGLLPEQVWDDPDKPDLLGRPTGSAMPLMWAHSEYIKLLRSLADARVFDLIPAVAGRYLSGCGRKDLEIWKPLRQVRSVKPGRVLRIQAPEPFLLHGSADNWQTSEDTRSKPSGLGSHWVDLSVAEGQRAPWRFTFYWTASGTWQGRDYTVEVGHE